MEQPPPPPGMPPPPPQGPPPGWPPQPGYPPPSGHYPSPPPKPAIDRSQIRPSFWWLGLAGGIFALGIAGAIVFIVVALTSIDNFDDDFRDFNAPGSIEVALDSDEEQGVYSRTRDTSSSSNETFDNSSALPPGAEDVVCDITDVRRERRLTKRASSSADNFDLTINDVQYNKLLEFTADEGGLYRITCRDATNPENRVPLAVGPPVNILGFVGSIVLIFLIPIVATMIAGTILVVVLVMRNSSKKRLEREALEAQS